jgi:uronate dehydrogenase
MLPSPLLLTGAAGTIGSVLRRGLRDDVGELRLTDRAPVGALQDREAYVRAELADFNAVREAVRGAAAVVHLGGIPHEASFAALAGPNMLGVFNVLEAARREAVRRVVLASSNHATGMYPVSRRLVGHEPVRPDSLYGVTKVLAEALGRLYADKFGLEVVCLRIGAFGERPREPRALATWLSHGDAVRLVRASLVAQDVDFVVAYGTSANTRGWWDLGPARERLGYAPEDDAERFAAEVGDGPVPADAPQGGPFAERDFGGWAV